jgi:FAD/FMN-containing dehydrogenase
LADGGLVIDLRRMHAVTVDAAARTATVRGGASMSHLDRATQPHGLATTGSRVSTTGVGGFTLGGGGGWLDRKFGLACDNLLSVELVTADGAVVRIQPA